MARSWPTAPGTFDAVPARKGDMVPAIWADALIQIPAGTVALIMIARSRFTIVASIARLQRDLAQKSV